MQSIASSGFITMGSFSLNDVLSKIGTFVILLNSFIKRLNL